MKKTLVQIAPDVSKLPGGVISDINISLDFGNDCNIWSPLPGVQVIDHLIDSSSVNSLKEIGELNFAVPVSMNGLPGCDEIGSVRVTAWVPNVADRLWALVQRARPDLDIKANDVTLTDWWQHGAKKQWEAIGISPLFRYMTYESGGQHCPHYDAGFIYEDTDFRTLKSFVLYLTNNETGLTRFVDDKQQGPIWTRKHEDWSEMASNEQVLQTVAPYKGRMLIFDHRMCHDVSEFRGPGERIIIRGDIIYQAVN